MTLTLSLVTILQSLFQLAAMAAAVAEGVAIGRPGCPTRCGNVTIPFPFGMGPGCYLQERFEIICNYTSTPPKPFLAEPPKLEVRRISVPDNTVQAMFPTLAHCGDRTGRRKKKQRQVTVDLSGGPFVLSNLQNRFFAVGCGNLAVMTLRDSALCGCFSICDRNRASTEPIRRSCSGIDCCEIKIPSRIQMFNLSFDGSLRRGNLKKLRFGECRFAYLVDKKWMEVSKLSPDVVGRRRFVPVMLKWMVDKKSYDSIAWPRPGNNGSSGSSTEQQISTHFCKVSNFTAKLYTRKRETVQCGCREGFQGNPYLSDGCQDINECEDPGNPCAQQNKGCINLKGSFRCRSHRSSNFFSDQNSRNVILLGVTVGFSLLFPLFGVWWLCKVLRRRKKKKLKQKFFKRNGGLLLQEQLSSGKGSVQKVKLFASKELEKATNYYNVSRLLGQGAQGTVYKGMLDDGIIVAVKKSMILDGGKLKQFINEVVILSQINHRNVVKLLGCCLETEVPLLVYEFIPNGTLHHLLHNQTEELVLTWDIRLRIAMEVSGALSYLHSAASMPIYHRDVKSKNILLDAKYRAKVADFGTSRSINIDQTHLTTRVEGTFGYMDPEYYQSSQYTEKSDVYSFGVVLFELLTRKKPVSTTSSNDSNEEAVMSHITSFILASSEADDDEWFGMIDPQVLNEAKKDYIVVVATLAKKCLSLTGKDRPTMKEVTVILEGIHRESLGSCVNVEYDNDYVIEQHETTCIEQLRLRSNILLVDTC